MSFNFKQSITDLNIKNAKFDHTNARITKLAIGSSLYLYTTKTNKKSWYLEYKLNGKKKSAKLGEYPAISLKKAKELVTIKKLLIKKGIDPTLVPEESLDSIIVHKTFQNVYEEFVKFKTLSIKQHKPSWSSKTAYQHHNRAKRYLLPVLADRPISEISHKEIKAILQQVQNDAGALEVRDKIKTLLNMIFEYAFDEEYRQDNPMLLVSTKNFVRKRVSGMKHVTELKEIKKIKSAIERFEKCYFQTKTALLVLIHTFLRPGELVQIEWNEVDFKKNIITLAAHKMKMDKEHIVPISKQVKQLLLNLRALTGDHRYVFSSPVDSEKHISRDSLSKLLRDYRIKNINPHGFRHTASTILNNKHYDSDAIELQLSHKIKGIRGIYNKAQKLDIRKKMMQDWSNFLEN